MVSTIEIVIKTFLDKLEYIKRGFDVSPDEAKSRAKQSIRFYKGCIGKSEQPLTAGQINEIIKKFENVNDDKQNDKPSRKPTVPT